MALFGGELGCDEWLACPVGREAGEKEADADNEILARRLQNQGKRSSDDRLFNRLFRKIRYFISYEE